MDLRAQFPPFYKISSEILQFYRAKLEGLPKLPFEKVRAAAEGLAGVYLMYTGDGKLLHVGMSKNLKKRFAAWKAYWKRSGSHKSTAIRVSLVLFPPPHQRPVNHRGQPDLNRIEWFLQVALLSVDRKCFEGDPFLFWNGGPPSGDPDQAS